MSKLLLPLLLLGWPPPSPGPTLFPAPPRPGEALRTVTNVVVRSVPAATDTVVLLEERVPFSVASVRRVEGVTWLEREAGGWLPAPRADRRPESVFGDLPVGREGLARGRVLPWDWRPSDLVDLPDSLKYPGYQGRAVRLREAAAEAYLAMVKAAAAEDLEILAFSGWRSGQSQRRLYRRALARDLGQRFSAAPGRSEHQLGTTLDVGVRSLAPLDVALEHTPAGRWLAERGPEFGWVISFSRARHEARGVIFEPWHLRWVGEYAEDESHW